jgi:hypothetical protein
MRRKNTRVEIHIFDIALHEAAHAVVGIHFKLPVQCATITTDPKSRIRPSTLGFVESKLEASFRVFTKVVRDGDISFVRSDTEKQWQQFIEKNIVMGYAGGIAKEVFGETSTPGELTDKGDQEIIAALRSQCAIPDVRLLVLRRRAERIVRTPFIARAIHSVALDLALTETNSLSAEHIRKIYREELKWSRLGAQFPMPDKVTASL